MRAWWRKQTVPLVRRSDRAHGEGCRYTVLPHLLVKQSAVSGIEMLESSPYDMRCYLKYQCNKWLCYPLRHLIIFRSICGMI